MNDVSEVLHQLMDVAITTVAATLIVAIPVVGRALSAWIKAKTLTELSQDDQARIEKAAVDAVLWAEEQAHKAIKQGGTIPGSEKLSLAAGEAARILAARGVAAGSEEIARAVEIAVRKNR